MTEAYKCDYCKHLFEGRPIYKLRLDMRTARVIAAVVDWRHFCEKCWLDNVSKVVGING